MPSKRLGKPFIEGGKDVRAKEVFVARDVDLPRLEKKERHFLLRNLKGKEQGRSNGKESLLYVQQEACRQKKEERIFEREAITCSGGRGANGKRSIYRPT